jgi:hypothetical protein
MAYKIAGAPQSYSEQWDRPMAKASKPNLVVPMLCAVAGGVIGHFAFLWIVRQGFYALALPGVLIGCAAGWSLRQRSATSAIICAFLALVAGIFSEWRVHPFIKNNSLGYFIQHLQDLRPVTIIMILLGAIFAAWFGVGRERAVASQQIATQDTPK